jgi:4-aminobutyrate aminotransferase-like enzyme/Ser/Thr protein kinase RdoA (MazF antagonist)
MDDLVPEPYSSPTELLRVAWGLIAERVTPLPGEYDANFRVRAAGGRGSFKFVLKVMHSARDRAFLDLQVALLRHVAAAAPSLCVSRVVPSLSGAPLVDAGGGRFAWLLEWIPGKPFALAAPQGPHLLAELGGVMGRLARALEGFSHPAAVRPGFKWDLAGAGWAAAAVGAVAGDAHRARVARFLAEFEAGVLPAWGALRKGVIHGDANDYNVVTRCARNALPAVAGLLDFGDAHESAVVADLAIAAAYGCLGAAEPLAAIAAMAAAFHAEHALTDGELRALFPLVAARLCVSVVNSSLRSALVPGDAYVLVSQAPALAALEKLDGVGREYAHAALRVACGLPAAPGAPPPPPPLAAPPLLRLPEGAPPLPVVDLSVGGSLLGADPRVAREPGVWARVRAAAGGGGAAAARHGEVRLAADAAPELSLCVALLLAGGATVRAPAAGVVAAVEPSLVALELAGGSGFLLLRGLAAAAPALRAGAPVAAGEPLGAAAGGGEGDGAPPLLVQLLSPLGRACFPGAWAAVPVTGAPTERTLWLQLFPDPSPLFAGLPLLCAGACGGGLSAAAPPAIAQLRAARAALLAPSVRLQYRASAPLHAVRGWRAQLFDAQGAAALDCYNNVPVLGHSHPSVVAAVSAQLALLTTNSRYLHETVLRYAAALTATLPPPLTVVLFLNSASEANECALRLARAATGRADVIVVDHAYHGNTSTLVDISPYKFAGKGGGGRKPWVHVVPCPDDYRGPWRRGAPGAGAAAAAAGAGALLADGAVKPAAFIAESLPSVAGQLVFPAGFLEGTYAAVRAAGGLCIADEVQTGFGRLGEAFWGFETQGVVPDVVVCGKPIGNGFPLGAVVTTPAIAAAFDNGMEYFSTFGGSPAAAAAGLAVLDTIQREGLQANARRVGGALLAALRDVQSRCPLIGDVRGMGLFIGVELVRNRATLEPATEEAAYVVARLRAKGVLTGTEGPHDCVLKLRPPLCFTEEQAAALARALEEVLGEDGLREAADAAAASLAGGDSGGGCGEDSDS